MKHNTIFIVLVLFLAISCDTRPSGQVNDNQRQDTLTAAPEKTDTAYWETYTNEKYGVTFKHPEDWKILDDNEVISVYSFPADTILDPGLHASPAISQVTFYPEGLGTELPFGDRVNLREYNAELPLDFEVDAIKSRVFQLENGQPWSYFLKFQAQPESWNENGFIFIQMKIDDYGISCLDENSGDEKPMDQCNPLTGDDVKISGNISDEVRSIVRTIIQSMYFLSDRERKPLSDLIRVHQPKSNENIDSPLEISGEARGYWFFEASFSISLVDRNDQLLASGVAQAKGDWMTEEFVPFEAMLNFDSPKAQRGYLIFKRANPSGMPDNDRSHRIPVVFD